MTPSDTRALAHAAKSKPLPPALAAIMGPKYEVLDAVAGRFGVSAFDLRKHDRKDENLFRGRIVAMVVLRQMKLSLPIIGRILNRDHSTVHTTLKRYASRVWAQKLSAEILAQVGALSH